MMEVKQAAHELSSKLRGNRWFVSVGVGRNKDGECLIVYVTSLGAAARSLVPSEHGGFEVQIKRFGSMAPLTAH